MSVTSSPLAAGPVLVAVTFDDSTSNLLKSADSLAKRLGRSLHVVHCSEYWVGRSWPSNGLVPGDMGYVTAAFEEESLRKAKAHLSKIVHDALPQSSISVSCELGVPADVVRATALRLNAAAIVLGGKPSTFSLMPSGLSTILNLQNQSPCPLFVFPVTKIFSWPREQKIKIAITDDLSVAASSVVKGGYHLATSLSHASIFHVHCNGLRQEDLSAALTLVNASAHTPETALTADAIWDATMKKIEATLADRISSDAKTLESSHCTLKTVLLHGNPQDELAKFSQTESIDLLVFGRHKTLHYSPFGLGRMPFSSMTRLERPLLIISSEAPKK